MKKETMFIHFKCLKISQLLGFFNKLLLAGCLFILSLSLVQAGDTKLNTLTRKPASFVHDDEFEPVVFDNELWIDENMIEDRAGVLTYIKNTLNSWKEKEEYASKWSLESTGLYVLPSESEKESFLKKYILKYLDKRIAGEIRNAEEGSTLKKIGQVQKALKPQTNVSLSNNFKLRFKARVLEGKIIAQIDNPYVDYSTEVKLNGEVNMYAGKEFKTLGVSSNIQYEVNNGIWIASLDKKFNEEWSSRISSRQDLSSAPFTSVSEQKFEVNYNLPF